jgi:hypothetical protein
MSCFFRERRPDTRTMLTRPLNQNLAQFVPNHIMFAIQPQHQAETILRPFVFPGTQGIGATLSNGSEKSLGKKNPPRARRGRQHDSRRTENFQPVLGSSKASGPKLWGSNSSSDVSRRSGASLPLAFSYPAGTNRIGILSAQNSRMT